MVDRQKRRRFAEIWFFASLIFTLFGNLPAFSQSRPVIMVETDPATFALKGYAAHLRVHPEFLGHWTVGAGAYSLDFPDLFINLNSRNKNRGWDVRLSQGFGLFTEYFFDRRDRGWFMGGQLAAQKFRIKNEATGAAASEFTTLLLMGRFGYRFFLAGENFYLQPWLGIGYTTKISGSNRLGTKTYDIFPVIPFMTVHFGYSF